MNDQNIKKKSVLKFSIFELPRLCPSPLPPSKHPNRVKTTERGYCAFIVRRPMCRGRGAGGRADHEFCALPPGVPPTYGEWQHGVTSRLKLCLFRAHPPMSRPGRTGPPAGESPDAAKGASAEWGGLRASPIENRVCWWPPPREGRSCSDVAPAGTPAVLWHPTGRTRSPCRVEVHVLCPVPCAPCAVSTCAICRCALCVVLGAARTPTPACPVCLGWRAPCAVRCATCAPSACAAWCCALWIVLCAVSARVSACPVHPTSPTTACGGRGGRAEFAWGRGCLSPCANSAAEMLPNTSCSLRAAPEGGGGVVCHRQARRARFACTSWRGHRVAVW